MAEKSSPEKRGLRTAGQTIVGTVTAYFVGLWAVPGVQEYTTNFIQTQGVAAVLALLAIIGVGAGVISFIQNYLEDRRKLRG